MKSNKNQGNPSSRPQSPKGQPLHEGGDLQKRSNDRATTTNSKPSPGHKK